METNIPSTSYYDMSETGVSAQIAMQTIEGDLGSDTIPSYNLAGFATTSMEHEAEQLMLRNISKNITHVEAYPAANEIEKRCMNMIARLFNAPLDPPESKAVGLSTLGSSEAIMLCVLAAKYRWQEAMRAAGKPSDRPNMVMSSIVHVCWKKAALYFDVEERFCECNGEQTLDPQEAVNLVDENTILVCAIMGTTYLGNYEDVQKLNDLLQKKNDKEGLRVMIHVDAAGGGFVVPFMRPNLIWDFRLPLVCSINTSGHKYGLTYAAVGWAIWRSDLYFPQRLLFHLDYCGSHQISFSLNFSKSSIHVLGQYYQLIRLGISGYRSVMTELTRKADSLAKDIISVAGGGKFVLMSKTGGDGLPIVVWRLQNGAKYDEFTIARRLRSRGFFVPSYTMAIKSEQLKLLRIVVRTEFSDEIHATFIQSLQEEVQDLDSWGFT